MEEPDLRSLKEDMVERVARALWTAASEPGPWSGPRFRGREKYMTLARTAIEAMREPTKAMLTACAVDGIEITQNDIELYWQDMIDAALQAPEGCGST